MKVSINVNQKHVSTLDILNIFLGLANANNANYKDISIHVRRGVQEYKLKNTSSNKFNIFCLSLGIL
jgi:hypothetical protein